ncbi:MAG: hypothetical protein ACE5JG_11865, partial [Planctomycetota bacterium]
ACHREARPAGAGGDAPWVRRYRGTSARCASCHVDVHRGQFRDGDATSCEACHRSAAAWRELSFDHDRRSRFPLDAAHVEVACSGCHPTVEQPDGARVVQYKPLGTECRDCHDLQPH